MSRRRVSHAKIKAAITGSGGVISAIARATGYSWVAVRDAIRNDEELTALIESEEGQVDDLAEYALIKSIKEGNTQDAKWWLARRRSRYGDRVDVTSGGNALTQFVIVTDEVDSE